LIVGASALFHLHHHALLASTDTSYGCRFSLGKHRIGATPFQHSAIAVTKPLRYSRVTTPTSVWSASISWPTETPTSSRMSAYKGHRGPNVSQYIANLNTLSPTQDLLADPLPVDDDFSAFLNADFFDVNGNPSSSIDFTSPVHFSVVDPKSTLSPKTGGPLAHPTAGPSVDPTMDFSLQGKKLFPPPLHCGVLLRPFIGACFTVVHAWLANLSVQWAAGTVHQPPAMRSVTPTLAPWDATAALPENINFPSSTALRVLCRVFHPGAHYESCAHHTAALMVA